MVPNWVYFGQGEDFKLTTELSKKSAMFPQPGNQERLKVAEHSLARAQTCRQQSDHFIYSTPALSVFFFSIIACSVLMALVFYYNDMLQKVKMQRT